MSKDDFQFEDFMLEIAWRTYEEPFKVKKEIESKANILLSANGILLGLVVNGINHLCIPLAVLGIVCLLISAICCLLVLKPRKYDKLVLENVLKSLESIKNDAKLVKNSLLKNIKGYENKNWKNIDDMGIWLNRATISFFVSLVLIVFAFILFSIEAKEDSSWLNFYNFSWLDFDC
jgi:hypothetical protein